MIHAVTAANDNALLFAIMPPNRFSTALKYYTDMIDMNFGFTVADLRGGDMFLPLQRLRIALDNANKLFY